jgi:hypothetical protein
LSREKSVKFTTYLYFCCESLLLAHKARLSDKKTFRGDEQIATGGSRYSQSIAKDGARANIGNAPTHTHTHAKLGQNQGKGAGKPGQRRRKARAKLDGRGI